MTMQVASANNPLHLQAVDRPNANPADANHNCGRDRRALAREQRQAAEIHRDNRKRAEQYAGIAPAQRHIPKGCDRQRYQLLCQWRMHRIEHRRRHLRLEHLARRRHIMHFIEIEFFRCRDADQKRDVSCEEQDDGDNGIPRGRIFGNGK